jgi:hypothetical protein
MNQLRRSPGTRREFSYFVEIPRNTKPVGSDVQLTKVLLTAATPSPRSGRYERLTCGFVLMMHLMNH